MVTARAMRGIVASRVAPVLAAVACGTVFPVDARAQGSVATDRAALEALYDATGGPNWTNNTNWKTDTPLSEWFGVTTDGEGRVEALWLSSNGLTGPIPTALGNLSNLGYLNLHSNDLTGPMPVELGRLANLYHLDLSGNDLAGPIPDALLIGFVRLSGLDLAWNRLSGPLPAALGKLSNLDYLNLHSNDLTGPLPTALGDLSNLGYLNLHSNDLTGLIPTALGDLSNLYFFASGVGMN